MWGLIIAGGGIIVTILGPISISGFGEFDWFIASVIKSCYCNSSCCNLDFNFIKDEKLDI